jgi:hypothetical protein
VLRCDDDGEKAEVLFAAMFPSDRIYWVRRETLSAAA